MEILHLVMIIAPLYGVVGIVGVIMLFITRPRKAGGRTIETYKAEWVEEIPGIAEKAKHSFTKVTERVL